MKKRIVLLLLTLLLISVMAFGAEAKILQSCKSSRGGHCVNLAAAAIPGLEFLGLPENPEPGDVLAQIYYFLLAAVGLSAFIAFTTGGAMYLFSGGSETRTSTGRQWMWNATQGLIIAMVSWLILFTISPDLVKRLNLQIPEVGGTVNGQALPPSCTNNRPPNCGSGCQEIITGTGEQLCQSIQPIQYQCVFGLVALKKCGDAVYENDPTCRGVCIPSACIATALCRNAPPPPVVQPGVQGDFVCKLPNSDVCSVNTSKNSTCDGACPASRCVPKGQCIGG